MGARPAHLMKAAGSALAIASIVFIALMFWQERETLSAFRPGAAGAAVLAGCALAYGALGYVLAEAWRSLLLWAGEAEVRGSDTRRIYARTQIAKYIPGNVAQFAGRQFIGRQAGWTHVGLLLSTVFELVSLVFVAATIATLAIAAGARGLVDPRLLLVAAILILAGLVVLPRFGPRALLRRWPEAAQRVAGLRTRNLWPVAALHALFFAAAGVILVFVAQVVTGDSVPYGQWPAVVGLYAIAWIVATLTPGAPSGIGVREVVLVAGLAFMTSAGSAILVATLLRAVTVAGDLLFFLVAGLRPAR